MSKEYKELFETIDMIAEKKINTHKGARSIEATVVNPIGNGATYILRYNTIEIQAQSLGGVYTAGDRVIILLPDGDLKSNNKYILGRTDYRQSTVFVTEDGLSQATINKIQEIIKDIEEVNKDNLISVSEKQIILHNWNQIISDQARLLVTIAENLKYLEKDEELHFSLEDLKKAYSEYYEFVFTKILKDLHTDTKLTDEEREQWNSLAKKYFNIVTAFEESFVRIEKMKINYSVKIIPNKGTVVKENTDFIFQAKLFQGIDEVGNQSGIKFHWTIGTVPQSSTTSSIAYTYDKNLETVNVKVEVEVSETIVATDSISIATVIDGKNGVQGPAGESSYTHIAYANKDESGAIIDFDREDPTGKDYIGIYIDDKIEDSLDTTKYRWSLIKGAQGEQGTPGTPGKDGKTPYFHVAYMNTIDNSDNSFSVTDSKDKIYLGQYTDYLVNDSDDWRDYHWTKIKGEDGEKGEQGPEGPQGPEGESSYTYIMYAETASGAGMSEDPLGKSYLGVCISKSSTKPQTPEAYHWSLIKGLDGKNGIDGKNGEDGTSAYLHIAYADEIYPMEGFVVDETSTDITNKKYIGQYVDNNKPDSENPRDYNWSLWKGADGKSYSLTIIGDNMFSKEKTDEHVFTPKVFKNEEEVLIGENQFYYVDWTINRKKIESSADAMENISVGTEGGLKYLIESTFDKVGTEYKQNLDEKTISLTFKQAPSGYLLSKESQDIHYKTFVCEFEYKIEPSLSIFPFYATLDNKNVWSYNDLSKPIRDGQWHKAKLSITPSPSVYSIQHVIGVKGEVPNEQCYFRNIVFKEDIPGIVSIGEYGKYIKIDNSDFGYSTNLEAELRLEE